MRRKLLVRMVRKGVSDLVVILALVAIAIPVLFTVQHWLGAQATKVSNYVTIPSLYATVLSKSQTDTTQTIVIKIQNKGSESYELLSTANVVFSNGTVVATPITVVSGSTLLTPGSSAAVLVSLNTTQNIASIIFQLINKSDGSKQALSVSLT